MFRQAAQQIVMYTTHIVIFYVDEIWFLVYPVAEHSQVQCTDWIKHGHVLFCLARYSALQNFVSV